MIKFASAVILILVLFLFSPINVLAQESTTSANIASQSATTAQRSTPVGSIASIKLDDRELDLSGSVSLVIKIGSDPLKQNVYDVPVAIRYTSGEVNYSVIRFNYTPAGTGVSSQSATARTATGSAQTSVATSSSGLTSSTLKYDLNKDGKINTLDISSFKRELQKAPNLRLPLFDFNNDGVINNIDYSMLRQNLLL